MKLNEIERAPRRLVGGVLAAATDAGAAYRPVILLASTCAWPSVSKLAIALAGAACTVVSVAPTPHPLNLTQAVSGRFGYSAARPLRSLSEAIVGTRPDLIIACDERVVEHLHRLHARMDDEDARNLIERSLGRPDSFASATARRDVMAVAAEHGIRVPDTRPVETAADLRAWAETQPFPWVLKADGSWGGLGVRIVSNLAAAERALSDLSRSIRPLFALRRLLLSRDPFWLTPWLHEPAKRITVQRYIEGRTANCAIGAWDGEALAGIAVEVVASDGESGPALVVRVVDDPVMLTSGARLVRAFGLSGLIGFDFVIETKTGHAFLLEMNPRATPICHLRLGAGRDPVAALAARLRGQPPPTRPAETARDTIALFPQANLLLPASPILAEAYQDAPLSEPRLMRAMMRSRRRRRTSARFAPVPAQPD